MRMRTYIRGKNYMKVGIINMSNEDFFEELQKNRNFKILALLKESISNAKSEENCTTEENEMYSDMQNLIESIENNYYK